MFWIDLWHILFYLISTALLFTRLKDLWPLHPHPPRTNRDSPHKCVIWISKLMIITRTMNHVLLERFRLTLPIDLIGCLPEAWYAERVRPCPIHSLCEIPFFFHWDISVISPKQLKNVCHFFVFGYFYYCIEVWKKVAILEWCQVENK